MGPSTPKNIVQVPSVSNSELGTLDVKMQPQFCANKPYMTITLQQMIELLQKNSKENFKLEAFVIVPSDSACATKESTREKAKALRHVIYEASEYHFKYIILWSHLSSLLIQFKPRKRHRMS